MYVVCRARNEGPRIFHNHREGPYLGHCENLAKVRCQLYCRYICCRLHLDHHPRVNVRVLHHLAELIETNLPVIILSGNSVRSSAADDPSVAQSVFTITVKASTRMVGFDI